jgi:hypothetical protein
MGVSRPRFELQSPKHEALHYKFKDQMGEARNSHRIFLRKERCRFRWENHTNLNIEMRMLGMITYEWLGNKDRSLRTKCLYV